MCDPMTIAGVALTAGSTVLNYAANRKVEKARDEAMAAERLRQNTLDSEATALNEASRKRYDTTDEAVQNQSKSLGDYFAQQTTAEPTAAEALPSAGASNITVQEEAKQRAKARDFTEQSGKALGELRAFGDVLGSFGRDQSREAAKVGQIGGFKRGSSNVLSYELEDANRKGDKLKLFGDILGGFGSVAMSGGLNGGGMFGAAAPAANVFNTGKAASAAAKAASRGSGALRLSSMYGSAV